MLSWRLIRSIQQETDLRLILPFGLQLRIGDVISVGKDGGFSLEGTTESVLGITTAEPRTGAPGLEIAQSFADGTTYSFRAAGEASTLFPELPSASAGFDVLLGTGSSWVLAIDGRALQSLPSLNSLRLPILDAYKRGVWVPDWALVTSIATAERMTLIASQSRKTKVALSIGAGVDVAPAGKANLTAGVSVVASSARITQAITNRPMAVACTALRVRDPWWRSPYLRDLEFAPEEDPAKASDEEFWEDVDVDVA